MKKGEKIDKLLHDGYSTISLGYIGLYEVTKLMVAESHTTPKGSEFAKKVMNRLAPGDRYMEGRNRAWLWFVRNTGRIIVLSICGDR